MASTARLRSLDRLRRRLEKLEKSWRPAAAPLQSASPLEARAGALNEARAKDWRDGPAALGFALALA
ncbi:MAG TPA: hypothetical protein VNH64_11935, partial [Parvularculaceae bacterium]|nr:hypothetical protein [Parvularculaceae bacterium]